MGMETGRQGRGGLGQGPCRILLVEDHVDTCRLLRLVLERRGHTVACAATLAEARQAMLAERIPLDVMVVDLELPDGRGEPLIGEFKGRFPGGAVIVASGHGYPADVARASAAGADAYLVKPFTIEQLEAAVLRVGDCPTEPKDVAG